MKTQIIRSIFLAIILVAISVDNDAQKVINPINTVLKTRKDKGLTKAPQKTKTHQNKEFIFYLNLTREYFVVSEQEDEHKFHRFHLRHKKKNLAQNLFNTILFAIFYWVINIIYKPVKN